MWPSLIRWSRTVGCRVKIHLNSKVLQHCGNRNQCGRDSTLITQSTVGLPSALQNRDYPSPRVFWIWQACLVKQQTGNKPLWFYKQDTKHCVSSVHHERRVPARQSVNTLPLNHEATYWSTQMKSVSFFPDHKLIKNPLCWHQTVWHKLKLIHNWVCIDFYPAFAGYIRAWLVSFCSGVYSKCKPCSGLTVHCALQ